jgi:outer membrane cobalamin receptor
VGKRYDYDLLSDANITLKAYADLSVNVKYAFDTKWTAFLEINNLLNNNYERFANFNAQGFQLLAGVIYKFDL